MIRLTRVSGMPLAALVIAPEHMAATGLEPDAWPRQQMEEFVGGAQVTSKNRIRVFNELVYDTDPNPVRVHGGLRHPKNLVAVDRKIPEDLQSLDEGTLTSELRPVLNKSEIRALLARRNTMR